MDRDGGKLALADVALAATIFLCVLGVLLGVFRAYMPLIEFREFIQGEYGQAVGRSAVAKLLFILTTTANREIPGAYVEWLGTACGISIPCLNAGFYAVFALGIALAYALARALGADRLVTTAALIAFALAGPARDVLQWQATILDSTALVFVAAALLAALASFRAASNRAATFGALLVLVLTAAALKSKEVAFPLPGALVLAAIVARRDGLARRLIIVAPALLYGAVHEVLTMIESGSDPRLFGGSVVANIRGYARALVPWLPAPPELWTVAIAAGAFILSLALRPTRGALLMFGAAVLFVLPCLRTASPPGFYLYVASACLAIGYAAWVGRPALAWRIAALLPPLVFAFASHQALGPRTRALLAASDAFRASFPALAQAKPAAADRIVFAYDASREHFHYWLVCSAPGYGFHKGAYDLWRFVDPARAEALLPAPAAAAHECVPQPACPVPGNWTICARYGPGMELLGIERRNGP